MEELYIYPQDIYPDGPCRKCAPDTHEMPSRSAWAVWMGPERGGDGQAITLRVSTTGGHHLSEEDAEWLRHLIQKRDRSRDHEHRNPNWRDSPGGEQ